MSTAEPPEIRLLAEAGAAGPGTAAGGDAADPESTVSAPPQPHAPDSEAPDPPGADVAVIDVAVIDVAVIDVPVSGPPDAEPGEDEPGEPDAPDQLLAPPVVAVVVTRNPPAFFEATLAALGAQDYPDLTVLVVDAGSGDDPTARVAAVLPSAFVRRLDQNPGFAGAANDALTAVEGAPFLFVCHDDVVLDPTAVRLLVEEAYRSNAAIVGPKLVDFTDHEILLDVGRAIDRLGGSHTGIESGELDQEQHDGVRDVFYVSSAAMLVRTDLFVELGGFDPDTFPGSEDLDLCWRARLAGARVMVVPDARGAHVEAADQRETTDRPTERDMARKRVRVVFTSYSFPTLLWVVPFGLVLSFVEAIAFALTQRRTRALAELGAWWWNLLHLGRIRPARRRTQALRTIRDRDLSELQVGPSARLRTFLGHHKAEERMETVGDTVRSWADSVGDALRHPVVLAFFALLVVAMIGSRELISEGVPAVGQFARWTGVHSMLDAYGSAWRYTGLGSATAAPPLLLLMGGLSTVLFGSIGVARTIVIVGALPLGAIGAFRLARSQRATLGPALITAIAYVVNPVARNAIAAGRFGPLVFFALAPFLLRLIVRVARFDRDPAVDGAEAPVPTRRPLVGLVVLTAIATACYPLAAPLVLVAALALLVGSLLTRGVGPALRGVGAAVVAGVGALVLLFPWSLTVADARDDPGAFGIVFHPSLSLVDVLRFHTGPAGGGYAVWGLFATAVFGLVVAAGDRLAWAARGWMLAAAGFAMVYVPTRLAAGAAVPAPEGPLTLAALGLAVAAGIGIGAFVDELRHARFGWRQLAALLAGAGIMLAGLGFVADALDGRWRTPTGDWEHELAFTRDLQYQGAFRVLWLGRASALPLDPFQFDRNLAYVLTRNGPGDAREMLRAPKGDADTVVRDAISLATLGRTNRLGRLLAPMGVRYVAVPKSNGPGGTSARPPAGLDAHLADQLDLAQLRAPRGLVLYENDAWVPERAAVPARIARTIPTGAVDPSRSALHVDATGAAVGLGDAPVPPGAVLLGEAYDRHWTATGNGSDLVHQRDFGWANSFVVREQASVALRFDGQSGHNLLLAVQVVPWLVLAGWWWFARRRDRARRARLAAERRAERLARQERRTQRVIDELELGDDFWSRL